MNSIWRAVRWPLAALSVVGALLVLALVLDTGSAGTRDVALLVGTPTLYLLLPLAVVWLVVALILHLRRRG